MKKLIIILLFILIPTIFFRESQLLSSEPSAFQVTKMMKACRQDDLNTVVQLLNDGYPVNYKSPMKDKTPLHWAAERNSINVGKLLIKNNADVEIKNDIDYTPLHEAADKAYPEFVRLLLDHDANVNAKGGIVVTGQFLGDGGKRKNTPLHLVSDNKKALTLIKLLIENGADINARNYENRTPLYFAVNRLKLDNATTLLHFGADINIQEFFYGNSPLHNAGYNCIFRGNSS